MSGGNVGGLSQAPSETENDRRTELKEVLQVIWDSLPQGPIDKAVKEFSKRLKACVAAEYSNCNVVNLLLLLERCYFPS